MGSKVMTLLKTYGYDGAIKLTRLMVESLVGNEKIIETNSQHILLTLLAP